MSSREWCAGVGWDFRFHYRESADRPKWPLFLKASKTTTSTSTVQVQCTVRSNGRAAQGSLHTSSSISTKYSTSMIWILASLYVPFINYPLVQKGSTTSTSTTRTVQVLYVRTPHTCPSVKVSTNESSFLALAESAKKLQYSHIQGELPVHRLVRSRATSFTWC